MRGNRDGGATVWLNGMLDLESIAMAVCGTSTSRLNTQQKSQTRVREPLTNTGQTCSPRNP